MQKFTRSFFAVGAVLGLAACGDDVSVTAPTPPPAATVTSVTVSPAQTVIKVGEKVILSANVSVNGSGVSTAVTWTTANAAIASVSAAGEVQGIAAGQTTVKATSTANAGVSGSAAITVSADKGVQSVAVSPTSAILAPGQSLQAVANVTTASGVAKTVTWTSSATSVATVDASGRVTAVTPGAATITATSTVDNTVAGALALTVRVPAAATISIKSITVRASGLQGPTDLNNVFGQNEFTLNVDPGDYQLKKVSVLIDGVEAASQSFGAEATQLPQDVNGVAIPLSEIVLSVNTAEFNTTTGETKYKNGPRKITAKLETTAGASAPTPTVDQTLVFRNGSGFVGALAITGGNTASDALGLQWKSGSVSVEAIPVLYGDRNAPFTVPTVSAATVTLLSSGCDTENTTRSKPASLSGGKWVASFANSASPVTGGAASDNVFRAEYNGCGTFSYNIGVVPSITATTSDNSAINIFLNNPYQTPVGGFAQPDANFAVRLDNRRPDKAVAPVFLSTNTTSPLVRTNNWVNDALVINKDDPNTTFRYEALTTATDFGVSRVINGTAQLVYESRVGLASDALSAIDASPAVMSVAALAETGSSTAYVMRAKVMDALGNSNNPSNTTLTGQNGYQQFGVDRTAPTLTSNPSNFAGNVMADTNSVHLATDTYGPIINAARNSNLPFANWTFSTIAQDPNGAGGVSGSGFFNVGATPTSAKIRRVTWTGTASQTRWWCPDVGVGFTTSTAACAGWTSGTSFQGLLNQPFGLFAAFTVLQGYYEQDAVVVDQAGNSSSSVLRNVLYDISAPTVGGLSTGAFLAGGQPATFSSQAADNLDLGVSAFFTRQLATGFPITGGNVYFDEGQSTLGTFGYDVLSTTSGISFTSPAVIRSTGYAAGGSVPGAISAGGQAWARAVDVAGNSSGLVSVFFGNLFSQDFVTNPLTTWSWNAAGLTNSSQTVTVDRDNPGAAVTSVTLSLAVSGPTQTFQNPFTSRVEFWVAVPDVSFGTLWRKIGESRSPQVSDDNVARTWTFAFPWNPDSRTAPYLSGSTTNVNIIAVGVNSRGDAIVSPVNTNVSVFVP